MEVYEMLLHALFVLCNLQHAYLWLIHEYKTIEKITCCSIITRDIAIQTLQRSRPELEVERNHQSTMRLREFSGLAPKCLPKITSPW